MFATLGAALIVTGFSGDIPAERAPLTPVEHAARDLHRISGGAFAHGRGYGRHDLVVPFEMEDGIENDDRFGDHADGYRGLTAHQARRPRETYARHAGVPDLGRGGFGGFAGAGASASDVSAGPALPPAEEPDPDQADGKASFDTAVDFDLPAAEAAPVDADVVAAGIVTEASGGAKIANALSSNQPMGKDDADALATPLPPSLLLFATGLTALGVSRRKVAS